MWAHIAAAVVSAKKKTNFELFCVPIFPLKSKRVWACGICQWMVPIQQGYALAFLLAPLLKLCLISDHLLHHADGSRLSLDRRVHLDNGNRALPPVSGRKPHLPVSSSRGITQLTLLLCHKSVPPTSSSYMFRLMHGDNRTSVKLHDLNEHCYVLCGPLLTTVLLHDYRI
jgi:hypothetical protein